MEDVALPAESTVSLALLLMGYIGLFGESGHETRLDDEMRVALRELVTAERFPSLAGPVQDGLLDEPLASTDRAFFFGLNRLLDGIQAWMDRGAADDAAIDRVPPVDDGSLGARRSSLEEVRRNIEAASLRPAARDGRFDRIPA